MFSYHALVLVSITMTSIILHVNVDEIIKPASKPRGLLMSGQVNPRKSGLSIPVTVLKQGGAVVEC